MDALRSHNEAKKKDLSPWQKKLMMKEIRRQCAEYYRKHEAEMVASMLWQLHIQEGWGVKRLRRFWESYTPNLTKLVDHYEMEDSERFWLCIRKLKDIGVDIVAWQNETNDDESEPEVWANEVNNCESQSEKE